MMSPVYINVFERQDDSQFLGELHFSAESAQKAQGPLRQFYFGSRPVYRLRVRLKVPQWSL